jgi:hypothetical protein
MKLVLCSSRCRHHVDANSNRAGQCSERPRLHRKMQPWQPGSRWWQAIEWYCSDNQSLHCGVPKGGRRQGEVTNKAASFSANSSRMPACCGRRGG